MKRNGLLIYLPDNSTILKPISSQRHLNSQLLLKKMEDVVKDLEKRRGWQNSCQKSLKLQHPIPPKDKHSKDEHKA